MASSPDVHGILVVDKPAGMTSHDVVYAIRRLFRTRRVGHTGTLDPDATGVLVLCLGNATRLAEYLSASRKHYVAEIALGVETDTQDASGRILQERDASEISEAQLRDLLPQFRGAIAQIPPMVSAIHHQGQRLYELARKGLTVERIARDVTIDLLEMTAFQPMIHPVVTLEITCSTGTYIRTLAADLGTAAGVGGHMLTLRRTWVGVDADHAFTLGQAYTLDALTARSSDETLMESLLPLSRALTSWPEARLDVSLLGRIRNGQSVGLAEIGASNVSGFCPESVDAPIAVVDEAGVVCAIGRISDQRLLPVKVLT